MKAKSYKFKEKVSQFNQVDGWHFVAIPPEITSEKSLKEKLNKFKGWKFLPIICKIGKTSWETSLLPLGKHSIIKDQKFIAIKKDVRKKEMIRLGDIVEVNFKVK